MIPEAFPAGYSAVIVPEQDSLSIGGYEFPSGTKVSVSQTRRMTKTVINGRKGSIKEEAGFDDWQVRISFSLLSDGYLFSATGESMLNQLKKIKRLWQKEGALEVTNLRMNSLGIKKLVLESFRLPDNPNYYQQAIEISALSDEDYKLGEEV